MGVGIIASSVVATAGTDVLLEDFANFTDAPWTLTSTPTIVAARTGNGAQSTAGRRLDYTIPALNESATITIGFAFRHNITSGSARAIVSTYSDTNTTLHNKVELQNDGSIRALTGVSVHGTSAAAVIPANTWVYLELQVKMHDSTGTFQVRVDEVDVFNLTSVDTKAAGTKTTYDTVRLDGNATTHTFLYDDLYVTMGAGAAFKGDITIPDVYSDDFNRANTTTGTGGLGSAWEDAQWFINNNRAERTNTGTGTANEYARFTTDLGTPDHWVEVDIVDVGAGTPFIGLIARSSGTLGQNDYTGYFQATSTWQPTIGRRLSGTYADVSRGTSIGDPGTGYRLRFEVEGNAQRLYRDGTLVHSTAATTHTTGNQVGMFSSSQSAGSTRYCENFRCGSLPYTPP